MAECIERGAFIHHLENCIDEIRNTNGYTGDFENCLKAFKNQPTADVQEIRHGEWETEITERGMYIRCSECHFDGLVDEDFSYCPNCGAKMDKE